MIRIRTKEDLAYYTHRAAENPAEFWTEVASSFTWQKPFSMVRSGSFSGLDVKWFADAKLNITENVLDRHLSTQPDRIAIYFEPNDPTGPVRSYTYKELHAEVCKTANMLKEQGIKRGDRVCFYMSMIPELLFGVLACARIGAVHSVVFGGFSAKSLSDRINDCGAEILITNDGGYRGKKLIPLKAISDEALKSSPIVTKVIVKRHSGVDIHLENGRDFDWDELQAHQSSECPIEIMNAEDPLFILYTSGSTGKPKGLLHTTAGYMVYAQYSFENVFQVSSAEDVFWCTADIGWITGHTYFSYGPLLAGATQVMFEGIPTWPDPGRFWQLVDKYKVTHFYTAPTAIRALQACGLALVKKHSLRSLKVLGSVGEPINEEAWTWYHEHIGKGRCPIVDTWWQTETGGVMISPIAGISETIPCFAMRPLPGIQVGLMDASGAPIQGNGVEGNMVVTEPWPSMARTVYGDHERYRQVYFSTYEGKYFTGDGVKRDDNGNYRIIGRVDDVINVSGHRIGTAEIEDALNQHPAVVESAVVGFNHDIKGQGIYAYVICTQEIKAAELKAELLSLTTQHIGAFAKPDQIQVVSGLPKTRSGKIMRRILRKIANQDTEELGDTSTLLNPEIVAEVMRRNTL